MTAANISLEEKYRLTRKALVKAGLDMTGGMDALHRDWRRWRDKLETMVRVDSVAVGEVDEWWARHLVQFRCLIDPLHVTARAVRAQKDSVVRVRAGRAVPLATLRSPASTQSDPNMNLCKRADEEHHD
jgi:hypothetical protein